MEDIRTKTKAFLARFFQNVDLQDDQDIFAMGFVNSLFAMQLVLFVENQFGVAVEDDDLDIDNFKSINAIASLIERKTATGVGIDDVGFEAQNINFSVLDRQEVMRQSRVAAWVRKIIISGSGNEVRSGINEKGWRLLDATRAGPWSGATDHTEAA